MGKDFMEKPLFGMFHTAYETSRENFYELVDSDYMNTIIVEANIGNEAFEINMSELVKRKDKCVWIAVAGYGFSSKNDATTIADTGETVSVFNPVTTMRADYKERVDNLISYLKEKGYYDSVVGFYMDEPLLWNITNDMLEEFTGYFRTVAAPDKRFFICFSVAGVAPESWTINDVKPINPKSSQYITDIAFDMYHPWSDEYQKIVDLMVERAGGEREDLRFWMIPCVMNYRGDKTEEHCLEHLQKCYEMLSKFEPKGGLMCYTSYTFPADVEALGNVGIDYLSNPEYKDYWPRLVAEIKRIGRLFVEGRAFKE